MVGKGLEVMGMAMIIARIIQQRMYFRIALCIVLVEVSEDRKGSKY